jgi:hypothetical protein
MAAVIKKNIYMDRGGFYKLYPNIYVFIVAKSGTKKGIPISMAKNLLEKSGEARVISGRNSVPRVIYDLGKMKTSDNGKVSNLAQAAIISGEMASFLVKDIDGLKILTDLYNTHEHEEKWINSLKGTGVDELKQPCITLLGATNDDHFAETIPRSDVRGGFIARTLIVYSTERNIPNALVRSTTSTINLDNFIPYLKELSKLKGEFKWSKESGDYYESWYDDFASNLPDDLTGTYNRIGDTIIKVAMLLSLSRNLKLEMDLDSLLEAKAECLMCAQNAHQISMGGSSTTSGQTRLVMQSLLSDPDHRLTRRQLLRKHWGDVDSFNIDLVAETLLGAGIISVEHYGKDTVYIMSEEVVKQYLAYDKAVRS